MPIHKYSTIEQETERFIKHRIDEYMSHRFESTFLKESDAKMLVSVRYDITKFCYTLFIRSQHGFEMSFRIEESNLVSINSADDWLLYHLQRVEPVTDTIIFMEWFFNKLNSVDKKVFRDSLYSAVKCVAFVPPRTQHYEPPSKITSDFLVKILFNNGQAWREVVQVIGDDPDTFLAMLLMVKKD